MRQLIAEEIKIFSSAAKLQAAFTAAVTDIITSAAHGLSEGDLVHVASSTTLPDGLSVSTDYYVRDVATNTFKLSAVEGGTAVDIADTGTGTHTFYLKGKKVLVSDAEFIVLDIFSSGNANLKLKCKSSSQDDVDFNAAASTSNRWAYSELKDLDDENPYTGSVGVPFTGTDLTIRAEININGSRWITLDVSDWVAGALMVKASLYSS